MNCRERLTGQVSAGWITSRWDDAATTALRSLVQNRSWGSSSRNCNCGLQDCACRSFPEDVKWEWCVWLLVGGLELQKPSVSPTVCVGLGLWHRGEGEHILRVQDTKHKLVVYYVFTCPTSVLGLSVSSVSRYSAGEGAAAVPFPRLSKEMVCSGLAAPGCPASPRVQKWWVWMFKKHENYYSHLATSGHNPFSMLLNSFLAFNFFFVNNFFFLHCKWKRLVYTFISFFFF